MGFDVFIDYMSSLEGNMEVHFLVFDDFVTVCQDRNVVIIVINFSNCGKTYRCQDARLGGKLRIILLENEEKNNKWSNRTIPVPFSSMISLRCQLTNPSFVMQCIFQAISDKRDDAEVRR